MSTDTLSRVVALVRDVYGTAQPIAADTALDEDSIGLAILAMSVEREFGVVLPWRTEEAWRTVADVVAAIEKARGA